jgi:UDP-N-acetylglucosamine:LPS N-acetylglucosamine transferase
MTLLNLSKNIKVLAISSGGGHLTELTHIINALNLQCDITYVTCKNDHTKSTLKGKKHSFIIDPHVSKIKYLINALNSLVIYLKIMPNVIISTGAGIAIPMILIGKLLGSKIIFIETGARIATASNTGKFIYKYSDLFIVQYEEQLKIYSGAKVGKIL